MTKITQLVSHEDGSLSEVTIVLNEHGLYIESKTQENGVEEMIQLTPEEMTALKRMLKMTEYGYQS